MYKLTFLPDGKKIEASEGSTILEASQAAEVPINSLCGGNGVCGRCRVQVADGKVRADARSMSFLSKDEIKAGYVLACQTKLDGDMEIIIPPESIPKEPQILLEGIQVQYSNPEKIQLHKVPTDPANIFDPLIQSIYLEMGSPTPNDNVSDLDRIIRELRKKTGYGSFEICLSCLRDLALELRENDWKITVTIARYANVWQILEIKGGDVIKDSYGAAVDIGTTTVVVQLVHMKSGNVAGVAGNHNPQNRYGEDVIARMIYACGREENGLSHLNNAVIKNINELIASLASEKGINQEDIHAMVAAGNTTMSHLFMNLKPCTIRLEPYVPTATVYPRVSAKDLNLKINPDGLIVVVPSVSSYVGGDIVAGILATGIADRPETRVLIDVGTNGEVALGNSEWLVCCSASAGPAFEGGGIRHGMRATRGAIEKFTIENGEVHYKTISNAKPRGICGSGLIDCLYEFARNQIIAGDGTFRIEAGKGRIIEKRRRDAICPGLFPGNRNR